MNRATLEDITYGNVDITYAVLILHTTIDINGNKETNLLQFRQENKVNTKEVADNALLIYDIVAQMTHNEIPLSEYYFSGYKGGVEKMKVKTFHFECSTIEGSFELFEYIVKFSNGEKEIFRPFLFTLNNN